MLRLARKIASNHAVCNIWLTTGNKANRVGSELFHSDVYKIYIYSPRLKRREGKRIGIVNQDYRSLIVPIPTHTT